MNYHGEIERCLAHLETLTEAIQHQAPAAAQAEADYKSTVAQVRLRHRATGDKLTQGTLDDLAQVECEELHLNYLIMAAQLDASRQALRATQARLDGLRTLAAGVRAITN